MFAIGRRKKPTKRLSDAELQKFKRDSQSRKDAPDQARKSAGEDDRSTATTKPMSMTADDQAANSDAPSGLQGARRAQATTAAETVPAPAAGERIEAVIEPGQTVCLDVTRLDNARFAVQDDALLIFLPNGGEIRLANCIPAAAKDQLTALSLADGTVVPAANLIVLAGTSLEEIAPAADAAEAVPDADHSDDAPGTDPTEVVPAAGHAESIAPTDTPPPARKENVTRRPHPPLPREKGNMEKGNVNTNEIKCYLSLDEMTKIIAEEVARRLEPERLLGEYTKETTVFDDGRVEVRFTTSNSAGVSPDG